MVKAKEMTEGAIVAAAILDDDPAERQRLAELLRSAELHVDTMGPTSIEESTASLGKLVGQAGPRVVLLDYRLDDAQEAAHFRGGSIAAALRDADATLAVPLVLLTTEAKLKAWVEARPGTLALFDWRILKGGFTAAELPTLRGRLTDLATGFWQLYSGEIGGGGWDRIAAALGVAREQLAALEDLEPEVPGSDSSAELARWILDGPLEWSGPLIDAAEARVVLGITEQGFVLPAVQEWLMAYAYDGLFASFGPRWWSAPLRQAVTELSGPSGGVDSNARAAALADHLGVALDAEFCTWCGQSRTIHACRVCQQAVDAAHSVRLLTARPPSWADAPVACYTCIVRGLVDAGRLVPDAQSVIEELQTGDLESQAP